MTRKTKLGIAVIAVIIIIMLTIIILNLVKQGNDNIPSEYEKKQPEIASFTNVRGFGVIDNYNPVFWEGDKYAFFQHNETLICYITKRISREKQNDWYRENYDPLFTIYKSNYKNIKYILTYKDIMYTFKDNIVTLYDLKNETLKKRHISIDKVRGINQDHIYFSSGNNNYKVSTNLKGKIKKIKNLPNRYDFEPIKYKFAI